MLAYFSKAYVSWILAHVLLRHFHQKLSSEKVFFIPIIATFIMVIWDLCMDPLSSNVVSLWVWKGGGAYFGVPLQNYFGWFLVVYIIFQLFALYLYKFGSFSSDEINFSFEKKAWYEATALYRIQTLGQFLGAIFAQHHIEIYASMALITFFTMAFVTLLSYITIRESKSLAI